MGFDLKTKSFLLCRPPLFPTTSYFMLLNTHTYYSLRMGTLPPAELVRRAKGLGYASLALTDVNNTSCALEFWNCCREAGLHPVLGVEFRRGQRCLYIGLARNLEGFRELNQLLSESSIDNKPLPDVAQPMEHAFIVYPRLVKPITDFRKEEYLGVRPEHVARLFGHELLAHRHKLVALSPVFFVDNEGFELHRLLRAIDENALLSQLPAATVCKASERLMPPEQLQTFYQSQPYLLEQAEALLAACHIQFEPGLHLNRQNFTGSVQGDFQLLEKLAHNGCERRYGHLGTGSPEYQNAQQRVRQELEAIAGQSFCPYFLITWDIVRYAAAMGYRHVGRGSGANSIVAYCLGITDVDPVELGLYFERFINPHRQSPPDFDIDFSWDERDDVTDYIFKRYGRGYTALLATYVTFQGRAVIRELGKVYGLPKAEIDAIIASPAGSARHHGLAGKILHYGQKLEGFPNYLSIHAGGVLIAQQPLYYHTALQMMPKGFAVAHFDMHHAEALGFHKYDILSQRGLGHLKEAVGLIKQNTGRTVELQNLEQIKKDEKARALLREGQCMGCFYIESPAMRGLLSKLRCDSYIHLVAASSIIRPGVARSGMMKEYIRRFHHPYSFTYPHPVFEEHLSETFGIMVYQEDVMKIAHHFGGLGLAEGDVLRRLMSGKRTAGLGLARIREQYQANCRARGYPEELAAEVWQQMESFAGYAFCKAHSASFAVESFQSLYLKAHYPIEFMVAVINNFGGFYQAEFYFHELRRCGGELHAPCVNHSSYLTTVEGRAVYMGFVHIKGLEAEVAVRVARERAAGGPFRGLADFMSRVDAGKEQTGLLIRAGAFRFTARAKAALLWEQVAGQQAEGGGMSLFPEEERAAPVFVPDEVPPEQQQLQDAMDEMELFGFPLCPPFRLIDQRYRANSLSCAGRLREAAGRVVTLLGYYVCQKQVRTAGGKRMAFGTWLGEDGHFWDTVHFPASLGKYPFRGKGVYRVRGKVVLEFGFPTVEVLELERLPYLGPLGYPTEAGPFETNRP